MTRHEEIRVEIEIDNETLEVARLTARITLLWNRLHKADPMAAMDLAAWLPSKRLVPPEFHTRTGQHSARREPL